MEMPSLRHGIWLEHQGRNVNIAEVEADTCLVLENFPDFDNPLATLENDKISVL
jgi:hypothetical protein